MGGDLTIAAGRGRGGLGGYVYIDVAPALAATTPGVLQHAIIVDPTASAVTLGTTAGTGLGSLYAGAYFAGTTAGIDKTCGGPVVSATFIKGIMTAMTCTSEPQPDPLTQTEVTELRGLLASTSQAVGGRMAYCNTSPRRPKPGSPTPPRS